MPYEVFDGVPSSDKILSILPRWLRRCKINWEVTTVNSRIVCKWNRDIRLRRKMWRKHMQSQLYFSVHSVLSVSGGKLTWPKYLAFWSNRSLLPFHALYHLRQWRHVMLHLYTNTIIALFFPCSVNQSVKGSAPDVEDAETNRLILRQWLCMGSRWLNVTSPPTRPTLSTHQEV